MSKLNAKLELVSEHRRIPTTLALYLIREAIPFCLLTVTVLTFIIFAQQVIRQNDFFPIEVSLPKLFTVIACLLPSILIITIPFSVLIATLLLINRLSSDYEVTALMTAGVKSTQIALPLAAIALVSTALTFFLSSSLNPACLRFLNTLKLEALKHAVEIQIKPQTLTTLLKNQLILVRNVSPDTGQWKGIFVYRLTPDNKVVIVNAAKGSVKVETGQSNTGPPVAGIQMEDGFTVTTSQSDTPSQTITRFRRLYVRLSDAAPSISDTAKPSDKKVFQEMSSARLRAQLDELKPDSAEYRTASVEWHKRLAMSIGALVLIIIAIPVGLSLSGRSGRTSAIITGLLIAIVYYILTVTGQNLALSGAIPVIAGVWLANISILTLSLLIPATPAPAFTFHLSVLRSPNYQNRSVSHQEIVRPTGRYIKGFRFFDIINLLVLKNLAAYSILSLFALLSLTIIFTLTDLAPSAVRNRIPVSYILGYFWYLTPYITYLCAPFSLLLGLLLTFGILARTGQLTALSASGLSPYKSAIPLLTFASLIGIGSCYLSEQIVPESNRRQDERYNTIKNRKTEQATLAFGKRWVYSLDDKLFSFQHISSDNQLLNVTAYDFNGPTHLLCRITHADRAEQTSPNTWQAVSGNWQENLCQADEGVHQGVHQGNTEFQVSQGAALFKTPMNESAKMSIRELGGYLNQLAAVGISSPELKIDYEKKKAFPLYCIIFVSLAFPFCLTLTTSRKILSRLTTGMILCLVFWTTTSILESFGRQGRLPAEMAVWGGPAAFLALGIYIFFRSGK